MNSKLTSYKLTENACLFELSEVSRWTKFFDDKFTKLEVFERFAKQHPEQSRRKALIVGTQWYVFSSFMPWFLCQAAAMVTNNEKRHYVIQTAYEELGMQVVSEIHPEMFWQSVNLVGINNSEKERIGILPQISHALNYLKAGLHVSLQDKSCWTFEWDIRPYNESW